MRYKKDWEATKQRFEDYWKGENTGRPLMRVTGVKPGYYPFQIPEEIKSKSLEEKYMDPESVVRRYRYYCETHEFLGESFPNLNADFGPGSLAAYLGSEIGSKTEPYGFIPA